jgi:hypothetical protein
MTTAEMRAARERGESQTDWDRVRASIPYVWDGQDEDDRPLSAEEMQASFHASRAFRPAFFLFCLPTVRRTIRNNEQGTGSV